MVAVGVLRYGSSIRGMLIDVNKKQKIFTMMLSIVVPVFVPQHLVRKIDQFIFPQLLAFEKNTQLAGIEIIYVANGCCQEFRDRLCRFTEDHPQLPLRLIWIDEAIGYTAATNRGILESLGEFILLVNDDAVLLDQERNYWINMMMGPMVDKKVGITGVHKLHCPHVDEDFLLGYFLMLRRSMLEEIGILDMAFSPGAGEDTDICVRARLHGWKVIAVDEPKPKEGADFYVGTFPIWHLGEQSFHHWTAIDDYKNGHKEWRDVFERNSRLLKMRKDSGYYSQPKITTNLASTVQGLPKRVMANSWW